MNQREEISSLSSIYQDNFKCLFAITPLTWRNLVLHPDSHFSIKISNFEITFLLPKGYPTSAYPNILVGLATNSKLVEHFLEQTVCICAKIFCDNH